MLFSPRLPSIMARTHHVILLHLHETDFALKSVPATVLWGAPFSVTLRGIWEAVRRDMVTNQMNFTSGGNDTKGGL